MDVRPIRYDERPGHRDTSGSLYYAGSPYTQHPPGSYTGTGINHSTAAFESGPSTSLPDARQRQFPHGYGGVNYFTEPTYTAASTDLQRDSHCSTARAGHGEELLYRAVVPGAQRQSGQGFNLPEMRVIGSHAAFEFRVDAYNLFNFQELAGTPTTSIVSTTFGESTGALAARIVELQTRFSF